MAAQAAAESCVRDVLEPETLQNLRVEQVAAPSAHSGGLAWHGASRLQATNLDSICFSMLRRAGTAEPYRFAIMLTRTCSRCCEYCMSTRLDQPALDVLLQWANLHDMMLTDAGRLQDAR